MRAGIWRAWKTSRSEDRSAHHTPQCRRLARTRHTTDQSSPPNPATPQHHALRRRFTASDTTLRCHACAITWTRERQIGLWGAETAPSSRPRHRPPPHSYLPLPSDTPGDTAQLRVPSQGRSKRRRRLSEPLVGVRHRAVASRLRTLACPSARATGAHTV